MFKGNAPDKELIELLVEAGFKEIVLPFESGNQRILEKYASNKWSIEKLDVTGLIKLCRSYGLTISGNYMIGYPDETRKEINETINMARDNINAGLNSAGFMLVLPLPGTPLYTMAVDEGYLPENLNIDRMNWLKANMINTEVPPEELEQIRMKAWEDLNDTTHVEYKRSMSQ